jgi:hypothetical protein
VQPAYRARVYIGNVLGVHVGSVSGTEDLFKAIPDDEQEAERRRRCVHMKVIFAAELQSGAARRRATFVSALPLARHLGRWGRAEGG